jgi:hypothetical protein
VVPNPPWDLAGGPWKVDGGGFKVAATQAEFQDAGLDETYNAQVRTTKHSELIAALDDIIGDALLPQKVKTFATKFKTLLT